MKETICTIPINDVFMPKDGCPFCRLEKMLEKQYVEFIVGQAMMEPSIRIQTNEKGFCRHHLLMMNEIGQKLPNALILESHLKYINENLFPKNIKGKPNKKQLDALEQQLNSCYVCERIETDMKNMLKTVFVEWAKGEEFTTLYKEQPFICLKHYHFVMDNAMGKDGIKSKYLSDFYCDTTNIAKKYLEFLNKDITYFCSMFDYRNKDKDWGTSKEAIGKSIDFLNGE